MDYFDRSILKKKKKNNYTSISNAFLQDNSLSFEARGVGASLLSRPDNWEINISAIMAEGKIGRDKVKKIITELIQAGYMYKSQSRVSGKFGKNILFISDEKDYLFEEVIEKELNLSTESNENAMEKNSSSVENYGVQPLTEKPLTDKPLTENPEQQIQLINKKKNITKTTTTDKKINIPEQKKSSSSSSKYNFLNNYQISNGTKLNICRYISDLTEDKFKEIYSLTLKDFETGEIKNLEAVLYKALKGEWTFKTQSPEPDNTEKIKNFVKRQADYWLAYTEVGYSKEQILNNFLQSVNECPTDLVMEYKNKILNYFEKGA